MIPSILAFKFDLILGSFLTFLSPNRQFLGSFLAFLALMGFFGLRVEFKTILMSTHVFEQLLFSIVLSILTFDFGVIFNFLGP